LVNARTLYFVVHPKNVESKITLSKAKKIILKKAEKWDDGSDIRVFLPNDEIFPIVIRELFGMDKFKWEEYWGKQSLESGKQAPSILKSELSIIKNISKNKKGFGIITDRKFSNRLKKSIKVILKVEI